MSTGHLAFCEYKKATVITLADAFRKDYDCFYASVFEAENPRLKALPLAVQQKHIIVTCNYEARRRGLHKLQLISEAKRICPEVIIVLGEDLTKFRDVSKALAKFLASHVWSRQCERLGFDEIWLDCTTMIDHNIDLLTGDVSKSFFHLDQGDPTIGFAFDARSTPGYIFPEQECIETTYQARSSLKSTAEEANPLEVRLRLGAHLASYLREKLEEKGFTATVGISVNRLLSKLVGNKHKPNAQTTLMPPYNLEYGEESSSVTKFLDTHEIGQIPGIGFKISRKLREVILGRESAYHVGFAPDTTGDGILVRDARLHPDMSALNLQKILGGPGWPKDIGQKVYELVNGVDDSEVAVVKFVPTQISIEDSYLVLDNVEDVRVELIKLSISLIKRMRLDLVEDRTAKPLPDETSRLEWQAVPRSLRLSTRPRPPRNEDGVRHRAFHRISRSGPFPSFLLSASPITELALRFVDEVLIKMFKRLHPEGTEWDLSLLNIAVTNMSTMAGDGKNNEGRDISKMLQPSILAGATGTVMLENDPIKPDHLSCGLEDNIWLPQDNVHDKDPWREDSSWLEETEGQDSEQCRICGSSMPAFAMASHLRFHLLAD